MKRIILDTGTMQHTISGKGTFPLRTARRFGPKGLYYERPIIDHPTLCHLEAWVIPEMGLQACRYSRHKGTDWHDWYVDVIHSTEEDGVWNLIDLYLDLLIKDGVGYRVLDGDELAEAVENGQISAGQVCWALHSMQGLCDILNSNGVDMSRIIRNCAAAT